MSIRYWSYAIALGGCLTGYPLAYAQEAEPKPLGTVEKNEGAATQAPAPERDSGKDATAKNEADPTPIADDKPSEEEPCASRCQTAEQREKDDLAAQQSMAASTLEIADLTYWQAAIGAAGLGMLGLTLYLTQKSLAEARRATRAAEGSLETMREQTRAYLTPGEIVEFTFREQCPHVRLTMINTGSTGTRETRHLAWIYFSGGLSCPRDETIRAKQNDTPAYYFAATPYDQTWKFDFCSELIPKNV